LVVGRFGSARGAVSVELRIDEGFAECDWGRFDNPEGDSRNELHHLLLSTTEYVEDLLKNGSKISPSGREVHSVTLVDGRIFAYIDCGGDRWTWEMFDAHWWDGNGNQNLMVGRWPD